VKPNWISFASIAFAGGACAATLCAVKHGGTGKLILYAAALLMVQLRLLCNLFDGMVAVEGGHRTKSGEVFNDLPDRIADPLILVSAGYAAPLCAFGAELGWCAGLLAVMTAYVRTLGGACGLKQSFAGPMAKQHRMAVISGAFVLASIATPWGYDPWFFEIALIAIVLGELATVWRRTAAIVSALERR
jgi:phosphatidylglycerophosphate synthase